MTGVRRRGRGDGGFETLEAVIMVPALLAFVLLVVFAGRMTVSDSELHGAARAAARAATQATSAGDAQARAQRAAAISLQNADQACVGGPAVRVNTGDLRPGGAVTVSVTCTVRRDDLGVIDATRTLSASATEVVDTYRSDG